LPIDIPPLDDLNELTNLNMVMEGGGGAAGDGGAVTVRAGGSISTSGDFANGLVAQSVAGGGGMAGIVNANGVTTTTFGSAMRGLLSLIPGSGVGFFGSVGGSGTAGGVTIEYDGDIVTTGDGAHGVLAQSAAGLGTGGDVDLTLSGRVIARGLDAHGVYAQSVGIAGRGDIGLRLEEGIILGGSGTGSGVLLADGADNSVVNRGTIGSSLLVDGNAITAGSGNEFVANYGMLVGSIRLGGGANALDSYGELLTGAVLDVGAGNRVLNAGVLSPGGTGRILATTVVGDLLQVGEGSYLVDVDLTLGLSDRLDVAGSADVFGQLRVNLLDAGGVVPGAHALTLLSSGGGLASSELRLAAPRSAVVRYDLAAVGGTGLELRYSVDFAPPDLAANAAALGAHVNAIQAAGSSDEIHPLVNRLVAQPDVDRLEAAYGRLSPHAHLADNATRLFASLGFDQAMHSCRVREGDFRFVSEGRCTWFRYDQSDTRREAAEFTPAVKESGSHLSGGWQSAISPRWHAGLALGYETSDLDISGLTEREAHQYLVGGILKGRFAGSLFTVSGSFGFGEHDVERQVDLPDAGVTAVGSRDVDLAALHLRYSYDVEWRRSYLRPAVDLGFTSVDAGRLTESGAGAASLRILEGEENYVTLQPSLEAGGELVLGAGALLRPYLRLGVNLLLSGEEQDITAGLAGAPAGVAPFTQTTRLDGDFTSVAAGIDVLWTNDFTLQLGYSGQYADTWDSEAAFLKLSYGF
jgi:hypothetical protein